MGMENADVYITKRRYENTKKTKQKYLCAASDLRLRALSTCTVDGEGSKDRVRRSRDCLCSTRYHYAILKKMPVSMTMLGTTHAMAVKGVTMMVTE